MSKRASEEKQPKAQLKKPKTGFGADPDVVVVVGGQEFHEHSQILRSWSEFFDAAYRSGMKESQTGRFDFTDRNPEEWKLLTSLLSPFSKEKVTKDNYEKVLSWCGELLIPKGLEECDRVIANDVWDKILSKPDLQNMLDALSQSIENDLPLSKERGFRAVCNVCRKLKNISLDHFSHISTFIVSHEECRGQFLGALKDFLPAEFPVDRAQRDAIVTSAAFPLLLHAGLKADRLKTRLIQLVENPPGKAARRVGSAMLKDDIASDAVIGSCFPRNWRKVQDSDSDSSSTSSTGTLS